MEAGRILEACVAGTVQILTVAVLAGMLARKRYRACYSFLPYLLVILVADLLLLLGKHKLVSPPGILMGVLGKEGFYSQPFYLIKELAINLLRFAVALELTFRTFRAFPGARSTARGVMFLLITVTLASVVAVAPEVAGAGGENRIYEILGRLQPRILNGTVWLLTGIAAVILWYRLPVDRFHKAILTGLVPYLLIFTIALNALTESVRQQINFVHTTAYLLLLAFWARAAWAPARAPAQAREPVPALERQAG